MTNHEQTKRRGVGRPRSAESHQAILDATLELVAEHGVHGASIEAIAERAGVGKTTIYRRWPSKEALILETLTELHFRVEFVDTGDLRADLTTVLKALLQDLLARPRRLELAFRVFGEVKSHPEYFRVMYEQVYAPRLQQGIQYIERAQARGELRPDLDLLFVGGLIVGPLLYYLAASQVLPFAASPDELPERIVDAVLNGIGTHPRVAQSLQADSTGA